MRRPNRSFLLAALLFPSSRAIAEVCDKVAPDWVPGLPPVNADVGISVSLMLALAISIVACWACLKRNSWMMFLLAIVLAGLWVAALAGMLEADEVFRQAVKEGCASWANRYADMTIAVLMAGCLGLSAIIFSHRQSVFRWFWSWRSK